MLKITDLDGIWQVRWTDCTRGRAQYAEREATDPVRYLPAAVPGEVHLDLLAAGLLDDPYVGMNVLKARWVEEQIWSYRRMFEADAAQAGARAWLVFEQLDYNATIFLNGEKIAQHGNFFRPCRTEVTGRLKAGLNLLTVHVESGLYGVAEKPATGYNDSGDTALHKRQWLRKPQCQFSWDWAPRLMNVGISGSVRLEYTHDPVRLDTFVPIATLSEDLKTGKVLGRLFVENLTENELTGELTLELAGQKASAEVTLKPGLHPVEVEITLDRPELWWPIGHGAQSLYTVRASLRIDSLTLESPERQVGFRHVQIDQGKHPAEGRNFIVRVNHRPIFCKGANFVPADMIFSRLDQARYTTLVDRAIEANFNMLRVWGGGLYESDSFYDLCDRKGILVWQDFIFACSKYPGHDLAFHDEVRAEATHQVRRLAHHASLIIWCGNNENEWGLWHWNWGKVAPLAVDHAIYHHTLPRIIAAEDPGRYYQPSSPYSPDGQDPTANDMGDQHPWDVGTFECDFRKYRQMICRFPNEGGIPGPTSLATVRQCLEGDRKPGIHSFVWQTHDIAIDTWSEPSTVDRYTDFWLGRDCRKMSLEQYTYLGGLVQGEGLREYIENFRRRMFDSSAAVFWMFNDCWPATRSWSIVDYSLRRTPAFWSVRRAMAPIHVVLAQVDDQIVIFGINETMEPLYAELCYGLMDLTGGYPLEKQREVTLAANASTPLASFPHAALKDPAGTLAFAVLHQGGRLLARNRYFEPLFKDMRWSRPEVSSHVDEGRAIFKSPTFAWGVCLDLEGESQLSDNMFDLYPNMEYAIPWSQSKMPKILFVGNLHS